MVQLWTGFWHGLYHVAHAAAQLLPAAVTITPCSHNSPLTVLSMAHEGVNSIPFEWKNLALFLKYCNETNLSFEWNVQYQPMKVHILERSVQTPVHRPDLAHGTMWCAHGALHKSGNLVAGEQYHCSLVAKSPDSQGALALCARWGAWSQQAGNGGGCGWVPGAQSWGGSGLHWAPGREELVLGPQAQYGPQMVPVPLMPKGLKSWVPLY